MIDAPRAIHTPESAGLYGSTEACPHCGKLHIPMPGDDRTWRCGGCDKPFRRSEHAAAEYEKFQTVYVEWSKRCWDEWEMPWQKARRGRLL